MPASNKKSAPADGLTDLRAALERLQGKTPFKAILETHIHYREGEGRDLVETKGKAGVTIEDGKRGLQLLYDKDLLATAATEEAAKERDPKAKTPTLTALQECNIIELRPMISAAVALSRMLEKAAFDSEEASDYNGKPVRLLTFALSTDNLKEKERKFVKKYEGSLTVWINADGTPLASRMHQHVTGRAYVVISFESINEDDTVYSMIGDRLLALRKETTNGGHGGGEKGERKVIKTLKVQA
jgi:hypothetical protein